MGLRTSLCGRGLLAAALLALLPLAADWAAEPKAAGRGDEKTGNVRAYGTIEPEEVVDVAAQVNGEIVSLSADFRSEVKTGDVLAKINDTLYAARLEQQRAKCREAEAVLAEAKLKWQLAVAETERAADQVRRGLLTPADVELRRLKAKTAEAATHEAEAAMAVSKVALQEAQTNFDRTQLRSPLAGVVIDRRVTVGQTVTAGAGSTGLFLIASDLKKIQVWVSVNETDITRIHVGQAAQFTVSAFPGKIFAGKVTQIRLNAQMSQNTVSYTVVVAVDNANRQLLPYLTANVEFGEGTP